MARGVLQSAALVATLCVAVPDGAESRHSEISKADRPAHVPAEAATKPVRLASGGGPAPDIRAGRRICRTESAKRWISANFADAAVITGSFSGRQEVETPTWVRDAYASDAKYSFTVRTEATSEDRRAAFTDVRIENLRSGDRYGAGIRTTARDTLIELFLADVHIEPNWPDWDSYDTTNFDGIVLDAAKSIFAQSLTIANWNADAALDIKADVSQFVDLQISGPGHRPIRYWRPGPHYLVNATIEKPGGGTLIWIRDCDATTLVIHGSLFNGASRLKAGTMQCESGESPKILYVDENPVRIGRMHPMFAECDG